MSLVRELTYTDDLVLEEIFRTARMSEKKNKKEV